ncbi:hypothetical protein N231_03140 [Geobacillus stearothermophilus ATCC 12980]|uniref:Uncharacterized protein n=1 Tax=Geobacillus stearothermophilus TaxID=1422 RepID=A0A150MCN8_GEOSE|nr:hypothetical protein GS8_3093 [Geobacillus stearothermophilus]KMY58747.1 hypothetical protein AA906_10405 [Geobacillus stearothermophilus]KOR95278.1 hypothetical protein N231_03140 [Geobacillus stearothermophilus ATCC 12980]KQC46134.1 hypothetical protein AP057_11910 [Geobacillus sp. Sah69]KYD22032.1 hypothetical protein B4109_2598 [Geobacillus stearothermophilus]
MTKASFFGKSYHPSKGKGADWGPFGQAFDLGKNPFLKLLKQPFLVPRAFRENEFAFRKGHDYGVAIMDAGRSVCQ